MSKQTVLDRTGNSQLERRGRQAIASRPSAPRARQAQSEHTTRYVAGVRLEPNDNATFALGQPSQANEAESPDRPPRCSFIGER